MTHKLSFQLFLVGNMWGISVNVFMLIPLKMLVMDFFFSLFFVFVLYIFWRKYEVPSDLCTVSSHCSNYIAIMCFGEKVFDVGWIFGSKCFALSAFTFHEVGFWFIMFLQNRQSYSQLSGETKAKLKQLLEWSMCVCLVKGEEKVKQCLQEIIE